MLDLENNELGFELDESNVIGNLHDDVEYEEEYADQNGEIVYEDQYQIAAKVDGFLQIEELQPSWAPEES